LVHRDAKNKTYCSTLLISLFLMASLSPFVGAESAEENTIVAVGDFFDYTPEDDGRPYLFAGTDEEPVYSGTRHLKQQWAAAGHPDLIDPFANNMRTSGRACENAWTTGQSGQVQTTGGQVAFSVMKVSNNAAILVQNGQSLSSTQLNNIASTWESTIYPTATTYFGAAPDVDNNCQIEIFFYAIDGGGGTGGYFMPGMSGQREIMYVDIDDTSWVNTILAHEFQHLLHNARDPFEFIWIDEGNADMSAYLCFGATNAVIGHANTWTQNASASVRWWNQRLEDYGAGFLFMLYLADKLGGGAAIQQLVADSRTGAAGITALATSLGPGSNQIGTTFTDIFANFTAAATLDDVSQSEFGLTNIDMGNSCSGSQFCKLQLTDLADSWASPWSSGPHDLEGWGVHAFKFRQGTGAPLNIMVQPSELGFNGRIIKHDTTSNSWSMDKLRFDEVTGIGTGLVHGFGNTTDEAYLIVWYESVVGDCDYTSPNCGFPGGSTTYPTAQVEVMAGLITEPADIDITQEYTYDRDGDFQDDSVEVTFEVNSTAFFEVLDVQVDAYVNNTLMDSLSLEVEAGNSVPVEHKVWFTPPFEGDWTLAFRMTDQLGGLVEEALTLPLNLKNMAPVAAGSAAANSTQTWMPLQFFGSGWDLWGLGLDNASFSHNVTPTGYIWDFGDGLPGSGLKNPLRAWINPGEYNVTLQVVDQGGGVSAVQNWTINVSDTMIPIVKLTVGGQEVISDMQLLTNQRVMFSAVQSDDNVPLEHLTFTWDWGDGSQDSGRGMYEAAHSWGSGSANGTAHDLTLTIDDGTHTANLTITVWIFNRVPRQIFFQPMTTYTLTPLDMPTVFTDDDGSIVSLQWWFDEDVNLGGGTVTLASAFDSNLSAATHPTPAWRQPGVKQVTVVATDDAGNSSSATLTVTVLNQRPVAIFPRPMDGTVQTEYTFRSSSFDADGASGNLTHSWAFSDLADPITGQNTVTRTFTEPGEYRITLVVTDERGLDSLEKSYVFQIENPLPEPRMSIVEAWMSGTPLAAPGADDAPYEWRHAFTAEGDVFAAPGTVLRFMSEGSRDGDPAFFGMSETNMSSPEWNGLTEYIWDFGDASPPAHSANAWHVYDEPGRYLVSLTVRDAFGTGDTNTTSRWVLVSSAPTIHNEGVLDVDFAIEGETRVLEAIATDAELANGALAWRDDNLSQDSDGDGDATNDRDTPLNEGLTYLWDLDDTIDSDGNGNLVDDWIEGAAREGRGISHAWNSSAVYTVSLKVCDDTGVCTQQAYEVNVRPPDAEEPSLSDLSLSDLIPSAESGSIWMLILIAAVLILGYFLMRQPDELELEAEEAENTYEVTEVHTEGGQLGMDQHTPPPKPSHLTEDDRRSKESGYLRPVRSRRR